MSKIIFKNAFLIDGISDEAIERGLVIVEDGNIVYSGNNDNDIFAANKEDSEVYDLKGMTLMPGMIDTHVHLSFSGEPSKTGLILEDPKLTLIKAVNRAKETLEAGFTTIRTMGERVQLDFPIKNAIEEGEIVGPRIVASGHALTITGGHGDTIPPAITGEGFSVVVDGVDEVRRAARLQLKYGADNIKLMATGGGGSIGPASAAELTIDEMKAAVEAATEFGKITGAHAIGASGIKNSLLAGVRTIEHGTFIDDEGIELMLEKNAYLIPTLSAFQTLKYGDKGGVPEYHLRKVEYYKTAHYSNLKKALKAGVKVATGTDAGTPFNYHGKNAYELSCLVECGVTPMNAIKSATQIAAEALNLDNLGTIEQGKIADIIIVDGNPLKDINILQDNDKIKMVFKEGELVKERGVMEAVYS